jgi:ribosomal protein S18 acetylase RimI-like enzyme
MFLYPLYLKEREGLETLEKEYGFAIYKLRGTDCYIQDIYVLPEHRKSGLCFSMADEISQIAKQQGYKILTGSVDNRASGAEGSHKVLKAYGMKPYAIEDYVTYYFKEIT